MKKQATVDKPEGPDPILWASGSHLTPGRLAMLRVRGLVVALLGLAAAVSGYLISPMVDAWWPFGIGVLVWLIAAVYAWSLSGYIVNVERTLWKIEDVLDRDITGDHYVGKPPEPATVTINGVEDDYGAEWPQAVVVEDTGQPPDFVRRFVVKAGEIGLARSAWVPETGERQTLGGTVVSRGVWKTMTDWLLSHQWAENNGKGLRLTKQPGWILRQLDRAEANAARAGSGQAAGRQEGPPNKSSAPTGMARGRAG